MHTHQERGIALILALFLMTALSVLGASLMFLSQTETYASLNYRVMSQARYAAEAGVQKAANFLLDPTQYAMPTPVGGVGPVRAYDTTKSPVPVQRRAGGAVGDGVGRIQLPGCGCENRVRGGGAGQPHGRATRRSRTSAYATLISMQKFESYGGGQAVVQTWEITGDGGMQGSPKATSKSSRKSRRQKCRPTRWPPSRPTTAATRSTFTATRRSTATTRARGRRRRQHGADRRRRRHQREPSIQGSVDVQGHLYTPRLGVGACTAGAITGESVTGRRPSKAAPCRSQRRSHLRRRSSQRSRQRRRRRSTRRCSRLGNSAACTALGLTLGTN